MEHRRVIPIHEACRGPTHCRRSSCLVAFWFWRDFGGALLIRRSRRTAAEGGGHNWWPHFLWARAVPFQPNTLRGWAAWRRFIAGWRNGDGYLGRAFGVTFWIGSVSGLEIAHMAPCPESPRRKRFPPLMFKGCVRTEDEPE